jgi:hypothetical protein
LRNIIPFKMEPINNNRDNYDKYKDTDNVKKNRRARIEFTTTTERKWKLKAEADQAKVLFSKYVEALVFEASAARKQRKESRINISKSTYKEPITPERKEKLKQDFINILKLAYKNDQDFLTIAQTIRDLKNYFTETEFTQKKYNLKDDDFLSKD